MDVTKNKTHLSNDDVQRIYDTYVVPNVLPSDKYVPLPIEKNNKPWRWDNADFPRIIALLEFDEYVTTHKLHFEKALAFNSIGAHGDPEYAYLSCENVVNIDYESNPEVFDLHNLQLDDTDFDFCMINQTLEHVYNPVKCLENIHKHLRPGGVFYCNVPVVNIPHTTPHHHYTGYTPTGLGCVAEAAGFEIMSIGTWGNREYILKLFAEGKTQDWPTMKTMNTTNPGLNDADCPVITWIFARKV